MSKLFLAAVPKVPAAFEEAALSGEVKKAILSLVPRTEVIPVEVAQAFEDAVVSPQQKVSKSQMPPQQQQTSRYISEEAEEIAIRQQQQSGRGDLFAAYHFQI